MKKSVQKISMAITLLLLFCLTFGCQQGKVTLDEEQKAEITETVKQLTKEAFEAGSSNDLERMFSYFSNNTITLEHGEIDYSWEEHKKAAREMMANIAEAKFTIDEMAVDVLSPDVAILYGKYHFSMTDKSGNTLKGNQAWTWVFYQEEGGWKIRHVHVSAPFQAN